MANQTQLHSVHQRVTGGTEGESAPFKKDGYASGPVPKSMRVSKVGADPLTPYSGPNVARVGKA